jgi:hypothetical protein
LPTDGEHEIRVLPASIPKHIGDGLLDVQFDIGTKRLEHRPDCLGIDLHDAPQALTRRAPDVRVTVHRPPARDLNDCGGMALANLDQRRGSHFSRLPLVARRQSLERWEYGGGLEPTSAEKLLDVLNLCDHGDAFL